MTQSANISVKTTYIEQQSDTESNRFVFSYTITIKNVSKAAFQLISRYWLIQDANNKAEEVYGEGVIGKQPVIEPGQSFVYTSGAVLETEMGTMQGKYFMHSVETTPKKEFEVIIDPFVLSVPRTLH